MGPGGNIHQASTVSAAMVETVAAQIRASGHCDAGGSGGGVEWIAVAAGGGHWG